MTPGVGEGERKAAGSAAAKVIMNGVRGGMKVDFECK